MVARSDDGVNERPFFKAFEGEHEKPEWFLGVKESSPELDALGVDAIAHVRYLNGDVVRVPIQLKSSRREFAKYYTSHPEAYLADVVLLVVRKIDEHHFIRTICFQALEERRKRNIRFNEYFAELENHTLSQELRATADGIRKRRGLVALSQAAE
jgi:hypothetical protein